MPPLRGDICLLKGWSPRRMWMAGWGEGSTEVCPPCILSTAFALSPGPGVFRPYPSPSAMTQVPQRSQGQGVACVAIVRGFPPPPARTAPRQQRTKAEALEGAECLLLHQLYWCLCGPRGALPTSSGHPLAHALVGHTCNSGGLEEAAGTGGVSAGAPR